MGIDYKKVADVLDSIAEYVDGIEATKLAAETTAREERAAKLAERYTAATGESVPEELKNKLASIDPGVLDQMLRITKHATAEAPEALGKAADIDDNDAREPATIKEASAQAEDKFLKWIIE